MANPGVGSKFVSVNLNKSYGQPPRSLGNAGGSRIRTASNGSSGGMVVLSRPRSSIPVSQKPGSRLSVPPPLNLPSLRKEHERSDSSSSGGGSAGAASSGSGSRPTSSGMGWTKPAPSALQEKNGTADHPLFEKSGGGTQAVDAEDLLSYPIDGGARGGSIYMPPSARSGVVGPPVAASSRAFLPVEKAVVLRGEDFPSLRATLLATSVNAQKQKDTLHQKMNEEGSDEQRGSSYSRPLMHMRPQMQSSRLSVGNGSNANGGAGHGLGGFSKTEQARKKDGYFPDPLPLVRLNHRSDWADDERDTGNGLPHRDRDHGFSRSEAHWNREFHIPQVGVPLRTSVHNLPDQRGSLRDNEAEKVSCREVLKADHYGRDVRTPSREGRDGSLWRASPLSKEGFNAHEITNDRNGPGARPFNLNRETSKENKYSQSSFGDNARNGFSSGVTGNRDTRFGRRDSGYGQGGKQNGNYVLESFSGRRTEESTLDRHSGYPSNRYRGDVFQNSSMPKASFSFGSKGLPVTDPLLNFGREKRSFSNSGKPYLEDPLLNDFGSGTGFDGRDPIIGVVKRKKDVLKQANFHDPVRESFEAELERVQMMQEQERQQIIEEQARALKLAQKEEEERGRLVREEEERRRRLEEEAREAAWRAEQERLDAGRRVEEQKMAREEEKRRIQLEEERRKESARQKLLELEARIARRQTEAWKDNKFPAAVGDERMLGVVKEKDFSRVADVGDWEDGEKMVERITSSASSDSSSLNRSFGTGSRPRSSQDNNSAFLDKGKLANSWKRDMIENGNNSPFLLQDQDNGYRSPMQDAFGAGRAFPRKEFYGGPGFMSARTSLNGGVPEHRIDEFPHLRGNRWNLAGDGDLYHRNSEIDPEFHESPTDKYKFSDMGIGQGRFRGSPHASYPERLYQNSEADGFSSFVRSRHSMRQPRVLPPPPLASMKKSSFRGETDCPGSSAFLDSEMLYHHASRKGEPTMQTGYDSGYQENLEQFGMMDVQQEKTNHADQKLEKTATPRCDSQSSLSFSSPPNSPTHLFHDDLDDSGDSPVLTAAAEGEEIPLSDSEHVVSATEAGKGNMMAASSSVFPGDDDEWAIENNEELQEQEEYDEEEDGFQEEDDGLVGDDENIDLAQEFEDMHSEVNGASNKMDQLVLGFDEGVEVGIPSDEFESINGDKTIGVQQVSVGNREELESFDGFDGNGQNLRPENSYPEVSMESSSKRIQETEKALQDLVLQSIDVPLVLAASDGYLLDSIEASSSSSVPAQHPVTSSVNITLPSHSVKPFVATVSPVTSQAEVPVKLPFGLFSGPSLIPSPVQALQIGSIQMPLHLHPQVGPSLSQIHPSQPPFFQFGQIRYTSPISQGILPLASQSMSFVQPNVPAHYSLNQNLGGPLYKLGDQDASTQKPQVKDEVSSLSIDTQSGLVPELLDLPQENASKKVNVCLGEIKTTSESGSQGEDQRHHDMTVKKNYKSLANNRGSQGQLQSGRASSQFISSERASGGSKAIGSISGSRGKKLIYAVRNSGSRSFTAPEASGTDSSGFQRRAQWGIRQNEFRVRENADRRQTEGLGLSNYSSLDEKAKFNGRVSRISTSGAKKDAVLHKSYKQTVESKSLNSGSSSSRVIDSEIKMEKGLGKEAPTKRPTSSLDISPSGEGNLKRNSSSEEDVDAPLQSGVVCVFRQPGIETPSDEDDFIEVRSKRQMLNDRREQREKEIKAKSRVLKASRKPRSVSQSTVVSTGSNKMAASLGGEAANNIPSESVLTDGQGLSKVEMSAGFTTTIMSQPLPPIGTPAVNTDAQADTRLQTIKSLQAVSLPVISSGGTNLGPSLSFETRNVILDNVQMSLGSWGNARINQQVMALTQTQLDEAMKPSRFDTHVASIGDHTSAVVEPIKPSSSISAQDKSFSSPASPLNCLLAGEKIQFGAVTSPTILPPSSCAVSKGIGPLGSCRSDIHISHNLSESESGCTLFFKKEKHPCVHLEDPEAEAEAEAAASAVAVAAITNDEIVGNGLGPCSPSVSVPDTKCFGGANIDGLTSGGGVAGDQQLASQSRAEESLTVALPADLSVETPSLSLWPSLPSSQNSSSQLLSHFPGCPPSHFPCYEMNPMLGAPIFTFGLHDESAGTQSQSQKNSGSSSGSLGPWQQCHSGVDSFYGPPAGFTGPFIGPPGGIPGVQGPPHMVVYNHFAPVGQFGQVGLSFMGTTYIPSGKQPDWKHNPTSSATGIVEGNISTLNMVSAQCNPPNLPAPIQHLAPGSPLLPMASPLAMFDMSPFQSSPDIPVQARWSHVPAASPLHSVPPSMPLQQAEGILPSQFSHGPSVDQLSTVNRFLEPRSLTPMDSGRNFPVATDATSTQFPDELGLVDPSSSTTTRLSTSRPTSYSSHNGNPQTQGVVSKSPSRSTMVNAGESSAIHNSSNNNSSTRNCSSQSMNSAFKTQLPQQQTSSTQQYLQPTGYTDQRGSGGSQKVSSGGDWSHRRMGFQGRNQSSGTEKNFASSKMKQIYVAKPTTSGTSTGA